MTISPGQAFLIGVAVGIVLTTLGQRWQAAGKRPEPEAAWQSSASS